MLALRTEKVTTEVNGHRFLRNVSHPTPRVAFFSRQGPSLSIGFALTLLLLGGILPAVEGIYSTSLAASDLAGSVTADLDLDNNGVEDLLDAWQVGAKSWSDLQSAVFPARDIHPESDDNGQKSQSANFPNGVAPAGGPIQAGQVRLLCLGATASDLAAARNKGAQVGICRVIHDLPNFGGVTVLAVDQAGLSGFLSEKLTGFVMLDRDGVPALVGNREMVGIGRVTSGDLLLGDDWSATVAILASGVM